MSNKEVLRQHAERFNPDVQLHVRWALDDITAAGREFRGRRLRRPWAVSLILMSTSAVTKFRGKAVEMRNGEQVQAWSGDDESVSRRTWPEHLHNNVCVCVCVCVCLWVQTHLLYCDDTQREEVIKWNPSLLLDLLYFHFQFHCLGNSFGVLLDWKKLGVMILKPYLFWYLTWGEYKLLFVYLTLQATTVFIYFS